MSNLRLISACLGLLLCLLTALPPGAQAGSDFDSWLQEFREEAALSGISEGTLRGSLDDLRPIPKIIEIDRRQRLRKDGKPLTFGEYMQRMMPESRVETARERFAENKELLREIGIRFEVDPAFLVALWAIESDFGRRTGTYSAVGALATLAHEGRRGKFFKSELIQLLKLIDRGAIAGPAPLGSWAGAMGQVQFMPSSFSSFALDFDGDDKSDLWNSTADALASAANYLSRAGWEQGRGWGRKVELPKGFDTSKSGHDNFRPLRHWRKMGVGGVDGPDRRQAAIILPEGPKGAAYLVYGNFKVLRRWNRSDFFALAVCYLAEKIDPDDQARKVAAGS